MEVSENVRKDPTLLLPEEPMSYELKKKKKKKKKRKEEDDPFKGIEEKVLVTERVILPDSDPALDPEVTIKVENIEVELDFNDFTADGDLMVAHHSDESQEPEVKIETQNHEAVLLTFESIINGKTILESSTDVQETSSAKLNTCKICHLIFKNRKTLHTHEKMKHQEFRKSFEHICETCGMSYEQKSSLYQHIKRKHGPDSTKEGEQACEICALIFKGVPRLRLHMRRKHGKFVDSFKYICKDCGLSYEYYRSLVVHRERKHSGKKRDAPKQWLKCPFCPKVYNKRETYARHLQRNHHVNNKAKPLSDEFLQNCRNEAGELECQQCGQVFSNVNYLKLHMKRKHNALQEHFRLKCSICKLSFDRVESLKRHVRRKHDQGSYCDICKKQFGTKEQYINHSHVATVAECPKCGLLFRSKGALSKHLRCIHKKDSPFVIFCSLCNQGFHDKRQLKPHMMKVHYKIRYTCGRCRKVFRARESYKRHIQMQHPGDVINEKQQCDQCQELFPDELSLCQHIDTVHNDGKSTIKIEKVENGENGYLCTKCPEKYESFDELKAHYDANHLVLTMTTCQVCGQPVPEKDINKHMNEVHKEEKELKCRYCDFSTTVKCSMTQHTLRHKNATTIPCDFPGCRYKTFYEGAMEKHKRNHQDLGLKLQCCQCPFQTWNKYILRYHEEAHRTGKKRYKCDQCDYATVLPANLVMHRYKHATEKRFKCDVCPFASKYNTSLRFHVKTKHPFQQLS